MHTITANCVLNRIMDLVQVSNYSELAPILHTTVEELEAISLEKLELPSKWFSLLIHKYDANPIWLLSGSGKTRFSDCESSLDLVSLENVVKMLF